MYHKDRVQAATHELESWQVGRDLFAADQMIRCAVNNLWGGSFTLISLANALIGFVISASLTIANDNTLVIQLVAIVAAVLITVTPWPAHLLHQAQLLRTTGHSLRRSKT